MRRTAQLMLMISTVIPALGHEVHLEGLEVTGMAVDAAGGVYLSGYTGSISLYGPMGTQHQVVRKLDAAGAPVFTVHLGDFIQTDPSLPPVGIQVTSVAVDAVGGAYITGFVNQAGYQTPNAAQPLPHGEGDAFIAKLRPDGSGLLYFTYLGGSGRDGGRKMAVDRDGNAYVTGTACSADFPTTRNAPQPLFGGRGNFGCDGFAAKLDATGSTLIYSTYLGGSRDDYGFAIAVDNGGNAYISGVTLSPDFPTVNAFKSQMTCSSSYPSYLCRDAFLIKLNSSGETAYSTYVGGSGYEQADGVAADTEGNAYVTGTTGSCDFPTVNALQPASGDSGNSCEDVFVVKVNPLGHWIYSTYLGGEGSDRAGAITTDASGNVYVTGGTHAANFPTRNPLQEPARGTAFISKLDPLGSKLLFSTCYGMTIEERETHGQAIALDADGNVYVSAATLGGVISDQFVLIISATQQ